MGDDFLHALAVELAQTQRALAPNCLFCVPQPRSLRTDDVLDQNVVYTHLLTPTGVNDDEPQQRLGAYRTLNGSYRFYIVCRTSTTPVSLLERSKE